MRHVKWAVGILLAAALAGVIVWRAHTVKDKTRPAGRRGGAVAVDTAIVRRELIGDVRIFTGSLQSRLRYVVAPKVPGRLEELPVNIGDALAPDQLIARIDDEEYVQQVAQAEAIVDVAKATVDQQATMLALAEREMNRVRALREKQIASEAEWDAAESEHQAQAARHKVALAQLAEKMSSLRAAEVRLAYTRISAPPEIQPGRWHIEECYVDAGAMLAANTPVLAVVDLSELVAVINVIERDYPAMRAGMPVTLETDAWPGTNFTGAVARMAPALRETSRQARVEISVSNPGRLLRPGMFVRARIEFGRREDAIVVPRAALARLDGADGVFLIDPEARIAKFTPVKVGIRTPDRVEILAPALEGLVATLGRHLLADGASVILSPSVSGDAQPARKGIARP